MKIRIIILVLIVLFTGNSLFCQCHDVYRIAPKVLTQDTFYILTINSDTFYIFPDTNWISITEENVPDNSKIDGTWLLLVNNNPDSILLKVTYISGLRDGELICYRKNGTLLEQWNYKNGKLHGKQFVYYYNGNIHLEENFKMGKEYGRQSQYFENGQIRIIKNYKDSLLDGEQKGYYDNGILRFYSYYIDGQPYGVHKRWYKNGKLNSYKHYVNGLRQGEFYEWDENGRITLFANYKDNIPKGASFGFRKGKLTFENYYEKGLLKRKVYEYYTYKTPYKYGEIKRRKKSAFNFSDIEHSIKKEIIYKDTILIRRTYYTSGQLKSEEPFFFFGEIDCKKVYHKTGEHKFWTEDGQLEKIMIFKDDKLIETRKEKN